MSLVKSDLFSTDRQVYITLFLALLLPAITSANTDNVFAPDLKSTGISCDANFKMFSLYEKNEIRRNNRESLLSSIDNRILKSCEMSSEEIQRRLLSKSVVLIDTRSAKEFESYRIFGALNIPPFKVKTKKSFKDKHLVIVNDSVNRLEMGLLCHELKQHGFEKVNFINGGLGSWDKELVGRDVYSIEGWMFGKITPRKFVSLKSKMEWLVLDVSNDDRLSKEDPKFIYDGLKVIVLEIENENSLDKIKNHMASFLNKNLYGFLVVSKRGENYDEVERYLKKNKIKNIYFLDGGLMAYKKYMAARKVFLSRLQRGPVKPSSCSSI